MNLRIVRRRAFDGPNLMLPGRALCVWLESGDDGPQVPPGVRFVETLRRLLCERVRPRRDLEPGPDVDAVIAADRPLVPAAALAVVALELQRFFGEHVAGWRVGDGTEDGAVAVAFGCEDHAVARSAAAAALDVLAIAAAGEFPDELPPALARFLLQADARQPDSMLRPLLAAVRARGIPCLRLNESGRFGRLTVLGQGSRRRLMSGTMTDATSSVARTIVQSKRQTNRMLGQLGFPVPDQALVATFEQARRAAARMGYPVVAKPDVGTSGMGITAGIAGEAELAVAFERAAQTGAPVAIERFVEGEDHRLLVAGGEVIAVTQRQRPRVTGDGRRTVRAMVDELNADPRRGRSGVSDLVLLEVDAPMVSLLARQGLAPDDVPAADREVLLRSTANIKSGGIPVDMSDRVHRDNRRLAETIAEALQLDFIGIDLITPDIARSYLDVPAAVIEVNLSPGIGMYGALAGESERIAARILESVYPPGETATIPLLAVVARDVAEAGLVARRAASIVMERGRTAAWYDGGTVGIGRDVHRRGVDDAAAAAFMVLGHPRAEAGVVAVSGRHVAERGLPLEACDVAVASGLGHGVAAVVAAAARRAVVAPLLDPAWDALLRRAGPDRLIVVGDAGAPVPAERRDRTRRAVLWSAEGAHLRLVLRDGERVGDLARLPDPGGDDSRRAMALAVAAAVGLGLGPVRPATDPVAAPAPRVPA